MSDHIERMKIEHRELKDELNKLNNFIHGNLFDKLDKRNQ